MPAPRYTAEMPIAAATIVAIACEAASRMNSRSLRNCVSAVNEAARNRSKMANTISAVGTMEFAFMDGPSESTSNGFGMPVGACCANRARPTAARVPSAPKPVLRKK